MRRQQEPTEPTKPQREDGPSSDRTPMQNVWHGVAALYAGALIYALVWQQLEVPKVLWIVIAFVAEPGAFVKLLFVHGPEAVRRLWSSR